MLNVFGPNLGTVRAISPISHTTSLLTIPKQTEGQQWQRHRKITASCFNEQNNDLVWAETVRQARGMLQYWSSTDSVRSTAEDTRVLSLHVLSSAGFGKSYPFESSTAASAATNSASYKQSLQLILDNCILLMVVGQKNLSKSWLPNKWKRIYQATLTFKQYMTEIYEEEKRSMLQGKPESNNLMTSLVRASRDMAGAENEEPRMKDSYSTMNNPAGLTETEIYGNIFVFNFAGHDTTAHTLAYAIVILAAHPEVQDWIAEELQSVLGDQKPEDWSYNGSFPRLKRCLAVLVSTPQHSGQIKDLIATLSSKPSAYTPLFRLQNPPASNLAPSRSATKLSRSPHTQWLFPATSPCIPTHATGVPTASPGAPPAGSPLVSMPIPPPAPSITRWPANTSRRRTRAPSSRGPRARGTVPGRNLRR